METKPIQATLLLLATALSACGGGGPEEPELPPFLLLVSVDTLRADRLGTYGDEQGLTPNLDQLAANSEVFQYAYAPTSFTAPSMCSLMSGRYPEQIGIQQNESILPSEVPTLAGLLAEKEYATGAVVSNWVLRRGAEVAGHSGIDRGFELYDDRMTDFEEVRGLEERVAGNTTDAALEMLDRLREIRADRVFLWVHYQDPHGPYTPPEGYREQLLETESERPGADRILDSTGDHIGFGGIPRYQYIDDEGRAAWYFAGYAGEIRYLDAEIGRLMVGLQDRELLDQAIIVFLSDHGEGMGEDDYWFSHGEYLSDALVRVPLFIRIPGRAPRTRTDPVSLVDVMPSLLPYVGAVVPSGTTGRNLLAPGAEYNKGLAYLATLGGSTKRRIGVVRDGFRYVVTDVGDLQVEEELYRLGADGVDVQAQEAERLELMRGILGELRERIRQEAVVEVKQALTEDELRKLNALGYGGYAGEKDR